MNEVHPLKIFMAEAFGTFFFLTIGLGALMLAFNPSPQAQEVASAVSMSAYPPLQQGLLFGVILIVLTQAMGPISGGHFNPAVSLGLMLTGDIRVMHLPVYIVGQILGCAASVFAVQLIFQGNETYNMEMFTAIGNLFDRGLGNNGFSSTACAFVEVMGAGLLTYAYIASETPNFPESMKGLTKGLAYSAALVLAVPLTNGAVNPLRAAGAAYMVDKDPLQQLWFFVTFPFAGAILAVIIHRIIHNSDQ